MRRLGCVIAAVAVVALPGTASAANLYVDVDTGDDTSNNCPQSGPCETIGNALTEAGPGDTILVDGGEYNETLTVGGGKSLIAQDFIPPVEGETLIDSVLAAQPAVRVASGDPAGTIEGFTIRSNYAPVFLDASATLRDNIFDEPDEPTQTGSDVWVASGAGSVTIEDNTFSDADTTDDQKGITTFAAAAPTISGNELSGFATAIDVQAGSASISNNDVSGFHSETFSGIGIRTTNGNATIEDNFVHDPGGDNPGPGIFVSEGPAPGDSGASLARNRVIGPGVGATAAGVAVTDTAGSVTFDGDVIAHYERGIAAGDNGGDGGGDVSLENVTVVDNLTFEIFANETHVTLDSSIVGAEGIASVVGTGTCSMTFTNLVPGGTPLDSATCGPGAFQHNLDPMFVDADASNYHLQAASPMIDAGNPTDPAPGATDPDGDNRALDGDKNCDERRDIGADELDPAPPPPDCSPSQPPSPPNGDTLPRNDFTIGKLKRRKLELTVPGPGAIEVTDARALSAGQATAAAKKKRLKPSSGSAGGAGTVEVKLRLTRKAKSKLKQRGKLKVNAAVTFTPAGGTANTETAKRKVKKKRG